MSKNTIRFTEKNSEGKDINVVIKRPGTKENSAATVYSNRVFADSVKNGCLTRQKLDDYMREQGLWDDEKADRLLELSNKIADGERQLARGGKTKDGKPFTKQQARTLAIDMRKWRFEQLRLVLKKQELDNFTAQAQAENAKFDYLVSCCILDEEGNRLFTDLDDYNSKAEEPYAIKAAGELAKLLNDFDPDFDKKRPENKFLLEHGFVNEDLSLIDKDGNLIDLKGNKIDKDGFRIDEEGRRLDDNGELVDEDGNPVEEFTPFED